MTAGDLLRRRIAVGALMVCLGALALEGCIPDARAQAGRDRRPAASAEGNGSVSWFRANPAALNKKLRECEDDPGGIGDGRTCRNARAARLAHTADRLRRDREPVRRLDPRPPFPELIPVPSSPFRPPGPRERQT